MGGSGVGRTSGEYPTPVTQEQFNGFVNEARNFFEEQRTEMGAVRSMLAEGQATMAVLRNDSATYLKRSDDASSKINLLTQKEAIRADREQRESVRPATDLPAAKPTIWDRLKDDLLSKILGVVALAIVIIGYHQLALFMTAHPSISPSGEGFTDPAKHDHPRESFPVSAPSSKP
jgi:hypothetical protein